MVGTNNAANHQTTQYNILTGGANNLLNNVAPSSTSGVPVISQGATAQPIFGTAAIAGGGTNATSFTATNGLVAYNGTSLVNYSGTTLNSSGVYQNSNQIAFGAYTGGHSSVTGDGTNYIMVCENVSYNVGSGYSNSTGQFTVPTGTGGRYLFVASVQLTGLLSSHTYFQISIFDAFSEYVLEGNPYAMSSGGNLQLNASYISSPSAAQNVYVNIKVSNGTKVVGLGSNSQFAGFKLG